MVNGDGGGDGWTGQGKARAVLCACVVTLEMSAQPLPSFPARGDDVAGRPRRGSFVGVGKRRSGWAGEWKSLVVGASWFFFFFFLGGGGGGFLGGGGGGGGGVGWCCVFFVGGGGGGEEYVVVG